MSNLSQAVKFSIEIHDLRTELDRIPAKVREIETELNSLETEYGSKKTEHDQLQTQRSQLERELQEENERLVEKEARLNAIKTQKEYQAVTREITTAKTANRDRENKILQLQSELEGFSNDLQPLEEKLHNLKKQLGEEKSKIQGTLTELEEKIGNLEEQLSQQLSSLPDDIREKYQRIERQKQPPAAMVSGGTCQACFMALPPQLFIEIQKGHEVHTCPNCHRLLYLEAE